MKHLLACVALLTLTACAPELKGANSVGGIVTDYSGMSHGKALETANAHCQKFGKAARISGENEWNNTITFDCVAP